MTPPSLARTNYDIRTAAFLYCVFPIGLHMWERGAGTASWTVLALLFLAYPHLIYWRAIRSPHPTRTELDNLLLDATLLGMWVAYLGFPLWITYALIGAAVLNATVNRGGQGAGLALLCAAFGAVLGAAVSGLAYGPETSPAVTFLCAAGSLGYTALVGYVVWSQNRRLAGAKTDLRQSEERYRLIAENADDLVAMVDHEGRWLYTSPSYRRVFSATELVPGADGYKRIHPDDAEQVRAALAKAAANGRPHELALRLVDRDGRVRQYRSRVQPVMNGPPRKLIWVSRDVTDLRESEERMLLAAHALEGMTEAIMITAADGTIVTVNRAFCEITGLSREEVLGRPEKAIRSGLLPPEFYDEAYATVHREGYWSGTTWSRHQNGTVYREWRSVRAIKDPLGSVTHYVHVFSEVDGGRGSATSTAKPVGA